MGTPAIEAFGLGKTYTSGTGRRPITALKSLDLRIETGEIFGLLGANGAGKTTTVKILLGLTHATGGSASILGLPVHAPESRRSVGYLPEGHRFPGYLTARETLSIFGRMSGVSPAELKIRIPRLLERIGLSRWADVRVKKFSKGMTQRLGLASALVHEPRVLLLDEPTDGVDPVGRREIRELLLEESKNGRTILLNSHLLSEIERTCSRVAILSGGSVVAEGRIDDLTRREPRYRLCASPVDEALLARLQETGAGIERENGHFLLSVRDTEHLNAVIDRIRADGARLTELSPERSSLEDVFVGLVRDDRSGSQIGENS
jgi:ABC-2 type transport system ATP-binding protein